MKEYKINSDFNFDDNQIDIKKESKKDVGICSSWCPKAGKG